MTGHGADNGNDDPVQQGVGRSLPGFDTLDQSLALVADLPGVTETLAKSCAWMGRVGWALILCQEDGTHLFPCAVAGLEAAWQPPLRLLSTTESWPVIRAALGQEGTGHDRTGPYPLPAAAGPVAWQALPMAKSQGALVALRPGDAPFDEVERTFLRRAVQLAARYSVHLLLSAAPPQSAPGMRDIHQGCFVLDLATDMLEIDTTFARLHDLTAAGQFPLSDVVARLPSDDLESVEQMLRTLRSRHGSYELAYRLASPTGRPRRMQARCTTSGDLASAPTRISGHVTDVTADSTRAREREEHLREQLRRADRMITLASSAASATGTAQLAAAACEALAVFGADALVLAEADQGRTRIVTTIGYDAEHKAAVTGIDLSARAPLTDALREQEPVFTPSHDDLVALYPHYAATLPRLKRHAWAALPLPLAPSHPATACMFSFDRPHAFGPSDHPLLIAAAALLGRALERCRDFDTEHDRAIQLQRGLLPASLPRHPRLHLAASYHPAAPGAHAGGDWYDAFTLPDGRIALVIGDAEGHHTKAAVLMGRLRTTVRAYAATSPAPADILDLTNRVLAADNDADADNALLATCCVLALDPHTGQLEYATAAHPPPFFLSPAGEPIDPEPEPGLPLGVLTDATCTTTRLVLPPGGRILLHTDGLTDTPGTDPDLALSRLGDAFLSTLSEPPALALHHITTGCLPEPAAHDDSALLLAHRTTA
ncbi:SpoIIE family protein phosphatase [Streptomyces sp. NPDC060194]|uniref:SpoIIE family protein phosphatase n=1 Tax=Streptomyces sp. NPDC060194 TaxID=3347069 RepID=UPI00364EEA4F